MLVLTDFFQEIAIHENTNFSSKKKIFGDSNEKNEIWIGFKGQNWG